MATGQTSHVGAGRHSVAPRSMNTWFHTQPWPSGTSSSAIAWARFGVKRSPADSRQHAGDVGVDHGDIALERKGQHGAGRVGTDPRERQQRIEVVGQPAIVAFDDHLSGRLQVPSSARIPEALPQAQHVAQRCRRARGRVGVGIKERPPLRDHPVGLGLLQHHLGDEDRPRVTLAPPRQVAQLCHAPREDVARVDQARRLSRPRRRCRRRAACDRVRTRASRSTPCARSSTLPCRPG